MRQYQRYKKHIIRIIEGKDRVNGAEEIFEVIVAVKYPI